VLLTVRSNQKAVTHTENRTRGLSTRPRYGANGAIAGYVFRTKRSYDLQCLYSICYNNRCNLTLRFYDIRIKIYRELRLSLGI